MGKLILEGHWMLSPTNALFAVYFWQKHLLKNYMHVLSSRPLLAVTSLLRSDLYLANWPVLRA